MAAVLSENRGWTSLHDAAANPRELGCLEELLKKSAVEVNEPSWCGETPLHVACQYQFVEGVKEAVNLLLQYGANANMRDKQGRTPLLCAAKTGKLDVVSTLLSSGHADPDLCDKFGRNPVQAAAFEGHWEIVECLLEAGACPPAQNIDGVTPIYLAAAYCQTGCLEKLLQAAVRKGQVEVIDLRTKFGFTPLMDAARNGHIDCVQILLRFGADPNLKVTISAASLTAFHYAIYGNHAECINLLLDKMDLQLLARSAESSDYVCPLQAAIQKKNHAILKKLLSAGFPVDNLHKICGRQKLSLCCFPSVYNEQVSNYQSALAYAGAVKDLYSMEILLDYKASVNSVLYDVIDRNGVQQKLSFPPVLSALCNGSWKAFDLLMEHGCDIHFQRDGICPSECLLLSFYDCHSTKKLLMCGSDPHLIFQQRDVSYEVLLSHLGSVFARVSRETFLRVLELLLQFMVVNQQVQQFFYDVFKLCYELEPNSSATMCCSEKWKSIVEQVNKPSSLKHACRVKVRQVVFLYGRPSFTEAIHSLPLPEMVKEFLLYSETNSVKEHTSDCVINL